MTGARAAARMRRTLCLCVLRLCYRVSLGAIAQLGERVLCKHEVVGSIPSGSTITLLRATLRWRRVRREFRLIPKRSCGRSL